MSAIGFGIVPVTSDPTTLLALHDVASELGAILGGKIEVHIANTPTALKDDFAGGRTQLLWSSPALALSSTRMRQAVPLACPMRQGVAFYHSVLLVPTQSEIRRPADLVGKSAAWVAPTSASGYVFPRIALAAAGVNPRELFAREQFLGTHGSVVEALRKREYDVGATFAIFERGDSARALLRAGHHDVAGDRTDLRVLLATPAIPSDLFLAAPSLHQHYGELLGRALEELGNRVPGALQTAFGADALIRTSAADLAELRAQLDAALSMHLFD